MGDERGMWTLGTCTLVAVVDTRPQIRDGERGADETKPSQWVNNKFYLKQCHIQGRSWHIVRGSLNQRRS